jgi:hypothetical protein
MNTKELISTPFRYISPSALTLDHKNARQAKAELILKTDDMNRGLILFVWQIYRKDIALVNLWNEITYDFVQRWEERRKKLGIDDDLDAEDYYAIIREDGIAPHYESFS